MRCVLISVSVCRRFGVSKVQSQDRMQTKGWLLSHHVCCPRLTRQTGTRCFGRVLVCHAKQVGSGCTPILLPDKAGHGQVFLFGVEHNSQQVFFMLSHVQCCHLCMVSSCCIAMQRFYALAWLHCRPTACSTVATSTLAKHCFGYRLSLHISFWSGSQL